MSRLTALLAILFTWATIRDERRERAERERERRRSPWWCEGCTDTIRPGEVHYGGCSVVRPGAGIAALVEWAQRD